MSDNGEKTTPRGLAMTAFGIGSARLEPVRGESLTFLNDMIYGWVANCEDTGILRFVREGHWARHEERYRDKMLKDSEGDIWAYIDGRWHYRERGDWHADLPIEDYVKDGFTIVDSLD